MKYLLSMIYNDCPQILLSVEGIDVDRPKSQCKTSPLMLASRMNFNTCLEKLLRNSPQINQVILSC